MGGFLQLFREWIGDTECPEIYFRWAALSLIAACLANRVHTTKQMGARTLSVIPNLYVLLLGPSGNGKSFAKDAVLYLLRQADHAKHLNLYPGKITAPALYESMFPGIAPGQPRHNPRTFAPQKSLVYLVNDELGNDLGIGEYADQFVKSLTEMYLGAPFRDNTVTRGHVDLQFPYCVNWLACTMREWLRATVKADAIQGGFFARVCVAESNYTGKRLDPNAQFVPPGHNALEKRLVELVNGYLRLEGEWVRTADAKAAESKWYMSRPLLDESDPLAPTRQREHALVLKLATILAVADSSRVIEAAHITAAIALVEDVSRMIPELAQTGEFASAQELLTSIRKAGSMQQHQLVQMAWSKGITYERLQKLVTTWQEAGFLEVIPKPRHEGGATLIWRKEPPGASSSKACWKIAA